MELTTDLTNISLTLSGFVLTILTVLITFKSTTDEKSDQGEYDNRGDLNVFKAFFSSAYYPLTIEHLKNCIKSILLIAALGFIIKLFVFDKYQEYAFYFNIFGLSIVFLTMWRCLLVLSKVLSFQKSS